MENKRVEEVSKKDPEVNQLNIMTYEGVSKFRSIRRAMSRGHITPMGVVAPKRPFNNRSRIKGTRPLVIKKEKIYEQLKHRKSA